MDRRAQAARLRLARQGLCDALAPGVPQREPLDAVEEVVVFGDEAPPADGMADREARDEVERLRPVLTGQSEQLSGRADVGGAEGAVGGDPVDVGPGVVDGVDGRPDHRARVRGQAQVRLREVPGHGVDSAAAGGGREAVPFEAATDAPLRSVAGSVVPHEAQDLGIGLGEQRP